MPTAVRRVFLFRYAIRRRGRGVPAARTIGQGEGGKRQSNEQLTRSLARFSFLVFSIAHKSRTRRRKARAREREGDRTRVPDVSRGKARAQQREARFKEVGARPHGRVTGSSESAVFRFGEREV